jgi:hypothetical protein
MHINEMIMKKECPVKIKIVKMLCMQLSPTGLIFKYLFLFIITKHYLLTAPNNYGDFWWIDNLLNPVT